MNPRIVSVFSAKAFAAHDKSTKRTADFGARYKVISTLKLTYPRLDKEKERETTRSDVLHTPNLQYVMIN